MVGTQPQPRMGAKPLAPTSPYPGPGARQGEGEAVIPAAEERGGLRGLGPAEQTACG